MNDSVVCENCGAKCKKDKDNESFILAGYCTKCATVCDDCDEIVDKEDTYISQNNRIVCNDCVRYCDNCDCVMSENDNDAYEDTTFANSCFFCGECMRNGDVIICSECDMALLYTESCYCSYCDVTVCQQCYDGNHCDCCDNNCIDYWDHLHDASYQPMNLKFYDVDKYTNKEIINTTMTNASVNELYLGVEVEWDGAENIIEMCDNLYGYCNSERYFYFKNDGSLTEHGVEINTHPFTIQAHRTLFPWEDLTKIVKYQTDNERVMRTCGIHVHTNSNFFYKGSKTSSRRIAAVNLALYKLAMFYDRHWQQMIALSRRRRFSYCERPTMLDTRWLAKNVSRQRKLEHHKRCGKYMAIQYTGATFETRLWCGTVDHETILASLELTNGIMKYVKDTSTPKVEKQAWTEVKDYLLSCDSPEFLSAYMKERGV